MKGAPSIRLVLMAWFLCALPLVPATGQPARKEKEPEQKPAEPAVHLMVAPRHGFRPLTVTLTGTLTGVKEGDPDFCHAGLEWEARTPSGLVTTSRQDPRCLHPPEQAAMQYSFTKVVTLTEPGIVVYRFILHKRDGTRLRSNTQEIRVLNLP